MRENETLFGAMADGEEVRLCRLSNRNGMRAEILTLGGIIRSIVVPDGAGRMADVVLGLDTLEDYLHRPFCSAAVIGRVANRISGAAFTLDGKAYLLDGNDHGNCLHGGSGNYAARNFKRLWLDDACLLLYLKDTGAGGFPGTADLLVEYRLTNDNELCIRYSFTPDMDTPFNPTNHCYFNLAGHDTGPAEEQMVRIYADFYTPPDDQCIPTGEIRRVSGTPLDLRQGVRIGDGLAALQAAGGLFGGFDHNYVLSGKGMRVAAEAWDAGSKRRLRVSTDLPGVQFYTGNNIPHMEGVKQGAVYEKHQGYCFETQFFPDSIHIDHFPCTIVRKGQTFETRTGFRFDTTECF